MEGRGAVPLAASELCGNIVSTEVPLVINESTPLGNVLVSFSMYLRVISDRTSTVT